MSKNPKPCAGTRMQVVNRIRTGKAAGTYAKRYGQGLCRECGKAVTCHKDGSAVYHMETRS